MKTKIFLLSMCETGFLLFLMLISIKPGYSQNNEWMTYYEKSGYKKTPRYEQTIEYCKKLSDFSEQVEFSSFGKSPQGRDLPLLIYDRNGNFKPETVKNTNNAILLIQAGIHSGEIDGKDAGLMLFREIAITEKLASIAENVTILFIPIFSVDGHERFGPYNRINQNGPEEMGWRTTAQNLNLNRDYLKADAPEMQVWLKLYREWLPDFFIDCHVTDGADYQYVLTYALETTGGMEQDLTEWTTNTYLEYVETEMAKTGFPITPYVWFRNWHDPKSGLISWVAPPRFSTGYTAIQNRPGLLIETHMLKDYESRVSATYEMLEHTISLLNTEHKNLRELVQQADAFTASALFRQKGYPVNFKMSSDSTMVDFLGFEYEEVTSDLTGGPWFQYSDKPVTFRIPFFNKQIPTTVLNLPEAYLIPLEWIEVMNRLHLHGVKTKVLQKPVEVEVRTYRFSDVKWQPKPFEGRHNLSYEIKDVAQKVSYPAGTILVDMNQRTARVAAHILEPQAPDSYVFWGFFNTIFEQKEYAESYVMEKMAREMLAENVNLRQEFETKVKEDTVFAKNPQAILNWFYSKTPYWDTQINLYPIGKIYDRKIINSLELN